MGATMKSMLVLTIISLISLQQLSILCTSINNIGNRAFALVSGKAITQRFDYAHFLPLTKNNKLHQVKVIVDYAPISVGQHAYMKVYGQNGTLLKISSFPHGVNTIAPGKAQFATTISDGTIKQVSAYVMFTNSLRNANYSNPINIYLHLGQTLQAPTSKSHVSTE